MISFVNFWCHRKCLCFWVLLFSIHIHEMEPSPTKEHSHFLEIIIVFIDAVNKHASNFILNASLYSFKISIQFDSVVWGLTREAMLRKILNFLRELRDVNTFQECFRSNLSRERFLDMNFCDRKKLLKSFCLVKSFSAVKLVPNITFRSLRN